MNRATTNATTPVRAPEPAHLALLSDVLRTIARTRRLPPEDADDYVQMAHCRLLERNYDVFERFAGRSSLRTYLTVVAMRLLLDWRNSRYGKWRPSREAGRLGGHAVALERLMSRDRLSEGEAIASLSARSGAPADDLEALVRRLPVRVPRRFESESVIDFEAWCDFHDPIESAERSARDRDLRAALHQAIGGLSADERLLLRYRFQSGVTLKSASDVLGTEPRVLYRRLQHVLGKLRTDLAGRGVISPESAPAA